MKRPFELVAEIQEKDAEIERLKRENAQLKKWALMTDEQVVMDLKALITELCEALEEEYGILDQDKRPKNLLKRAREATRCP